MPIVQCSFFWEDEANRPDCVAVYSATTGARVVAGTVVLNSAHTRVLLISSCARRDRWIIPKGGVELDETADFEKAAVRETWEEAGVVGTVRRYLGVPPAPTVSYACAPELWGGVAQEDAVQGSKKKKKKGLVECHFYEMEVGSLEDEWPEMGKRERRWATYEEARFELLRHGRTELARALELSSLAREAAV